MQLRFFLCAIVCHRSRFNPTTSPFDIGAPQFSCLQDPFARKGLSAKTGYSKAGMGNWRPAGRIRPPGTFEPALGMSFRLALYLALWGPFIRPSFGNLLSGLTQMNFCT